MSDFIKFVGSVVITLMLVSIPGFLVASVAYEWPALLKIVFCAATVSEGVLTACLIMKGSEDETN